MIDDPGLELLRNKITTHDFTETERDLILTALNMGDWRSVKREYPTHHGPGSSKWATAAWAILDKMSPDALTVRDRFMLGGMIAGALKEMYDLGRKR
jgi:hypothetical protein